MANREIKFRAWNTKHKYMDDTVFIRTSDGAVFDVPNFTTNTPHTEIEKIGDVIVMQYTGLKDANGVEIYEGDIVEYLCDFTEEVSNHQVKYFCNDDYPAFDFSPSISEDMNGFSALAYQEIGTVKVIGNIYQNQELLND